MIEDRQLATLTGAVEARASIMASKDRTHELGNGTRVQGTRNILTLLLGGLGHRVLLVGGEVEDGLPDIQRVGLNSRTHDFVQRTDNAATANLLLVIFFVRKGSLNLGNEGLQGSDSTGPPSFSEGVGVLPRLVLESGIERGFNC